MVVVDGEEDEPFSGNRTKGGRGGIIKSDLFS